MSIDKALAPFMTKNQTKHQTNVVYVLDKKSDDRVAIFSRL